MSDLTDRLRQFTPEQRRALRARLDREHGEHVPSEDAPPLSVRLSLYFFASATAFSGPEYYELLLQAAEFGDRAGFHAAWIPERHFVDFGGYSPNPSVLAAAIAARTQRIRINAGSVAAPLHHPVRIAEEWSAVDNISRGRVGISFATGWHPDDFVLAREDHADRRATSARTIEQVRGLWAGEAVSFPTVADGDRKVRTSPRPLQERLPVWLTTGGNPETFSSAGRLGYGVMCAAFGQTLDQVSENIRRYREAWRSAGHPGEGDVVVMTHAYVSDRTDLEDVVRPALYDYLAAHRAQTADSSADASVLLEAAFQDLLHGPSLIGTPAKARSALADLAAAGADEVGCLIDFGLPGETVLDGLSALAGLLPSEDGRPGSAIEAAT